MVVDHDIDGEQTLTRRKLIAGAGAAGIAVIAGCSSGNGGDGGDSLSGTVQIAGSSTVFPLSVAVGEEFQRMYPDVSVSVDSTGTGGGFGNFFCEGETDINDASRSIKPDEEDQCADNGVTPIEFQVAIDAITVIVNNEADWVDCITVEELKQIWEPNGADTWSDVRSDWPDEPFELYGAASTSGTFDYFTESIIGEEDSHRDDYQATEQDNTIIQGVSGAPNTMGYFGYAYYSQNQDSVKALGIDDGSGCVKPSLDTAKDGEYTPLSRGLYIYVAKESLAEETVREFARFYLEQTSTSLISDVGYVPMPEADAQANLDELESVIDEL